MQRLRSIQVLRALAVTGAIASHATYAPRGAAGVDLFFVISGVIIGKVMRDRSATEFMRARLLRIYPIYWFNLAPLLAVAFMNGIVTPARLASSLTLWPVWGSYTPPFLVPAWTLCFEMVFYCLIALGLWCKKTWSVVPALLLAILLNLVTRWPILQFIGNPIVLEFCAGLAVLLLPKIRIVGALALVLAVVLFALSAPIVVTGDQLMDPASNFLRVAVWGVSAALAVYGTLCFEGSFGKWADVPVFIGNASYSIYLSHYLVNLALFIWWPAKVAAMLAIGSMIYVAVELPVSSWTRARRSVEIVPRIPAPIGLG